MRGALHGTVWRERSASTVRSGMGTGHGLASYTQMCACTFNQSCVVPHGAYDDRPCCAPPIHKCQGFVKAVLDVADNLERAAAAVPKDALGGCGGCAGEEGGGRKGVVGHQLQLCAHSACPVWVSTAAL